MMQDNQNAFRAGLVVLAGIAIGLAFFFTTQKSTLGDDNSHAYFALLDDASGINAKSLITVAGLQVGEIQNIELMQVSMQDFAGQERGELESLFQQLQTKDSLPLPERTVKVARYQKMHGHWVQRFGASDAERASWESQSDANTETEKGASPAAKDDVPGVLYTALPAPPAWFPDQKISVARVDMRVISNLRIPLDSWLKKESLGVLGAKALFLELGESQTIVSPGERVVNVRAQTGLDALQNRAEGIVSSLESITRKIDRDIGGITQDVRGITHTLHRFMAGDGDTPPLNEVYELVMNEIRKVAVTVERAVRDVDGMLVENDDSVAGLLRNLNAISTDIAALTSGPSKSVDGTAQEAGDLRQTMTQIRKVSDDLAVVTSSLKNIIGANEGEVDQGVKRVKHTLDELNRSLTSLAEVSGRVERGEGTVGRLLTDERMADKLEYAVSGASDFVSGLTSLETHVDLGTWYNFNEGTARVTFGLKLQPKPDKFYLFEIIEDGGGIERLTRTLQETTSSGSDVTEREVVRQYDNSIRITAMFAKRFWDFLVLRAGLIETSGGVGANLYFWDDRVELRSDLFNFSGPRDKVVDGDPLYGALTWPRWRTLVKFQPVPYVYLTAGVDDVLNFQVNPATSGYGLDYFMGAGITFQDEDLRSILPFVPSL